MSKNTEASRRYRATPEGQEANRKASRESHARRYSREGNLKSRNWVEAHPARQLFHDVKKSATKRGIPFNLTPENVENLCAGMRCTLTGLELRWNSGIPRDPLKPSIDRLDASGPYSAENTHLVALFINLARNSFPLEPFKEILKQLKSS